MQTIKLFFMAALALTFAACSNDDNDIITPEPAKAEGIPFTATITVDNSATTRALSENGTTIEATWATGEKVALIYNAGSTPTKTEAEVTKQTNGTATISATLAAGATDGSDVTIIYPATAADGTTGNVKADVLAAQNGLLTGTGSIAEKYDLRKGTGKLSISGGKATVNNGTPNTTVSLTNQIAIFKFTVKDAAGTSTINVKPLTVTIGVQHYVITPASATSTLYVALPAVSGQTVTFSAMGTDGKGYGCSKASVTFAASKFYQSPLKMTGPYSMAADATDADKDKLICVAGHIHASGADAECTAARVAKIIYVGSDNGESSPYNHGLALALSDAGGSSTYYNWSTTSSSAHSTKQDDDSFEEEGGLQYNTTHNSDTYPAFKAAIANNGTAAPTGCSAWFLASGYQWAKMFTAAGGAANLKTNAAPYTGLRSNYYWSSSECDAGSAWYFYSVYGYWYRAYKNVGDLVRSCLAF